jgi:predicted ATP-dependent endonuclease of OLD family
MPITVFVGPNNSGKSMILSEIQRFCFDGGKNVNKLIVDSIELEAISEKLIKEKIKSVTLKPNPGEVQQPDHIFVGKQGQRQQVDSNAFLNAFKNPNENPLLPTKTVIGIASTVSCGRPSALPNFNLIFLIIDISLNTSHGN